MAYGACLTGPSVGVVQLSGFGFPVPGQTCGLVEVVPAPDKTFVIAVNCSLIELPMQAGTFRFNTDGTCPCVDVNATEATTWGKVKSLYR